MAKNGVYRIAYTYVREGADGSLELETGRSPVQGPVTVINNLTATGVYSADLQITHVYIYSTLVGGSTYFLEKKFANTTGTGAWSKTLNMADTTLAQQASAYWTGEGYESKRLAVAGVVPPMAFVTEAGGRLWAAGRMQRYGTNEQSTLYWSELSPFWRDWPIINAASTFAAPITGIYEWNEFVYAFTRDARFKVTPNIYSAGIRIDKLEGGIGCIGHHTIQKVGAAVVWMGQDGVYAVMGDDAPQLISVPIRDTYRTIAKDRGGFFQSRFDNETNQYVCWCSSNTNGLNDFAVVCDMNMGMANSRWTTHGHNGKMVFSMAQGIGVDGSRIYLVGDHLGNLWQDRVGLQDGSDGAGTYQGLVT